MPRPTELDSLHLDNDKIKFNNDQFKCIDTHTDLCWAFDDRKRSRQRIPRWRARLLSVLHQSPSELTTSSRLGDGSSKMKSKKTESKEKKVQKRRFSKILKSFLCTWEKESVGCARCGVGELFLKPWDRAVESTCSVQQRLLASLHTRHTDTWRGCAQLVTCLARTKCHAVDISDRRSRSQLTRRPERLN